MNAKVMLADDEEGILALLSMTLGGGDYDLILARDGEEALRLAKKEGPDVLVLDLMMPKKTGYEVCQHLKSSPATANTKIIVLTALTREAGWQKAKEAGADEFFTKPFSPTALLSKMVELTAAR